MSDLLFPFAVFSWSAVLFAVLDIVVLSAILAAYNPVGTAVLIAIALVFLLLALMFVFDNKSRKYPMLGFWLAGALSLAVFAPIWLAIPIPFVLLIEFMIWELRFRPFNRDEKRFFTQWILEYRGYRKKGMDVSVALNELVKEIGKYESALAEEIRSEAMGKESDPEDARVRGLLWHLYVRAYGLPKEAETLSRINEMMRSTSEQIK